MRKKNLVSLIAGIAFLFTFLGCAGETNTPTDSNSEKKPTTTPETPAEKPTETEDVKVIDCKGGDQGYNNYIEFKTPVGTDSGYTTFKIEAKYESDKAVVAKVQLLTADNKHSSPSIEIKKTYSVTSGACLKGSNYDDYTSGSAVSTPCADSIAKAQFFIQDSSWNTITGKIYVKKIWLSGKGKQDLVLFDASVKDTNNGEGTGDNGSGDSGTGTGESGSGDNGGDSGGNGSDDNGSGENQNPDPNADSTARVLNFQTSDWTQDIEIIPLDEGSGYTTFKVEARYESTTAIQASVHLESQNGQSSENVYMNKTYSVQSGACLKGAKYEDWSTGSSVKKDCVDGITYASFQLLDSKYGRASGKIFVKKIWLTASGKEDLVIFDAVNGEKEYTITISDGITNGTVTTNVAASKRGDIISVFIKPGIDGYDLDSFSVKPADNSSVKVNGIGYRRTFKMPPQNVTLDASFISVTPVQPVALEAGIDGTGGKSGTYVTFGTWPQTIKASNVTINENETKTVGSFIYYKGSDGEWYTKRGEAGYDDQGRDLGDYHYSDSSVVERCYPWASLEFMPYCKWFKEEPIKWRVLTTNYNGTNTKLLLAENILTGVDYGGTSNNYKDSDLRAWLNDDFIINAFSQGERAAIVTTTVDNSNASTYPADDDAFWSNETMYVVITKKDGVTVERNTIKKPDIQTTNPYICENTYDKVFLPSLREFTTNSFGFQDYYMTETESAESALAEKRIYSQETWEDDSIGYTYEATFADPARRRKISDYALALGVQSVNDSLYGNFFLRSPFGLYELTNENKNFVFAGEIDGSITEIITWTSGRLNMEKDYLRNFIFNGEIPPEYAALSCAGIGVVPALCVKN